MNKRIIWSGKDIPDLPDARIELTDLVRFKGHWYCSFREGTNHYNHPSGRGRVIRSSDGHHWETVWLNDWDCGDVREPKLSVTSAGDLMINTSVFFVSEEPRSTEELRKEKLAYQYEYFQLEHWSTPQSDEESEVARQSVTWLSSDGVHWESATACASGINTWRWLTAWHRGMGYSVGYGGKDRTGTLYRTRDGKHWKVLKKDFFPNGVGNEAALAFDRDHNALCLLRDACARSGPLFGKAAGPRYQDWTWKPITLQLPDGSPPRPFEEIFYFRNREKGTGSLRGPRLVRTADGRILAAGSGMLEGDPHSSVMIFEVSPEKALFKLLFKVAGTSYAGVCPQENRLLVSYIDYDHSDFWKVCLEEFDMPIPAE